MDIVNHVFTLRAEETIHLPEYKGSTFHGGFGRALHAISPTWSAYFLKPKSEAGQVLPSPYVLLPPLDEKTTYAPGECFSLNLTLFGTATQHHALAQAAVEYLGRHLGLGYRHGKYSIQEIVVNQPPPMVSGGAVGSGPVASELADSRSGTTHQVKFQLITRLRLKQNNRLHRQAPDFPQLLARLIGRVKTLQHAYGEAGASRLPEFDPQLLHQIQYQDHTNWDDWDRFSGRQKTWMKFGGLRGEITYRGELQPFMSLLRLGEWIHIGGKTSFGLGKYRLIEEATE